MENKIKKLRGILNKKIDCGDCYDCCGVILFSRREKSLMTKALLKKGIMTPPNGKGDKYCEYLNTDGRCSVYEQRPIICRGFGIVDHEALKCPIGKHTTYIPECVEITQYRKRVLKDGIMNQNAESILGDILPTKD